MNDKHEPLLPCNVARQDDPDEEISEGLVESKEAAFDIYLVEDSCDGNSHEKEKAMKLIWRMR